MWKTFSERLLQGEVKSTHLLTNTQDAGSGLSNGSPFLTSMDDKGLT